MDRVDEKVKLVADLLEQSDCTVAFTGPGIFAESDLPRGDLPQVGLWTMVDPDDFTIQRYKQDPESFYEAGAPYFSALYQLEPNDAHRVLAELEKRDLLKAVITQNIEGLHRKAGSKNVLKLHGTIRSATCEHCDRKINIEDVIGDRDIEEISFPLRCPVCGEPLKPDVVLPGEPLPPAYYKARDEAARADLMLVVGPEAQLEQDLELPGECKKLIVISRETTPLDKKAQVVINEEPAKVMKLLLKELDRRM